MDHPITNVFAMAILITGLSLLAQAPRWALLLKEAVVAPHRLFPLALFLLMIGLWVVTFHNLWAIEWRLVITLVGWLLVAKASVLLIAPELLSPLLAPPGVGVRSWIRGLGAGLALCGGVLYFFHP